MKKNKNQVISVPTSKSSGKSKLTKKTALPTKNTKAIKKIKPSPVDYYNCLLTSAQSNWFDPSREKNKRLPLAVRIVN